MASNATIGIGTKWEMGNGATPEVWTEVGGLLSLDPPDDSIDIIDITAMDSPDYTREFMQGLNDPGEAGFTFIWEPGGVEDELIQAWRVARGTKNHRITWNNGEMWTFGGLLTSYKPEAPIDDKLSASVSIKVTSSYVRTPA